MLDFFDSVINFFDLIWQFLSNMISGILTLLNILISMMGIPARLTFLVPGVVGSCIIAVAAIGVAKLIAGWGNK